MVIPGDGLVSAGESSSGVAGARVTELASRIGGVCVRVCVCLCTQCVRMSTHGRVVPITEVGSKAGGENTFGLRPVEYEEFIGC